MVTPYLDPKEPAFLGLLVMISLYKSFNAQVVWGQGLVCGFRLTQRVQSNYIVECRASILGITIMIWGSIPHNST